MDFFSDCTTEMEKKERYRELCKLFHPDKGGDSKFMIELNKQFKSHENYTPNFTCYNSHIPFDHHIYEQIRRKDIRIRELMGEIECRREENSHYYQINHKLGIELISIRKERDELRKESIELKQANMKMIEKIHEYKKLSVWQMIKNKLFKFIDEEND